MTEQEKAAYAEGYEDGKRAAFALALAALNQARLDGLRGDMVLGNASGEGSVVALERRHG